MTDNHEHPGTITGTIFALTSSTGVRNTTAREHEEPIEMWPQTNDKTRSSLFRGSIFGLFATALMIATPVQDAYGQTRIKDIVNFEGVRENMLVGYGLIVGLNGTGDALGSAIFTRES
ncbi:MAG: flagellar basal body P-ring protein FlgI, partial [Rhodospirillaceae bacterium]